MYTLLLSRLLWTICLGICHWNQLTAKDWEKAVQELANIWWCFFLSRETKNKKFNFDPKAWKHVAYLLRALSLQVSSNSLFVGCFPDQLLPFAFNREAWTFFCAGLLFKRDSFPPLISRRFLEYFRASESTKINHMRSNHRHKITFQDIVYLKFNKRTAKILKKYY